MPPNIIPAAPTEVFPQLLASAFNEQLRVEALVNQAYTDGSSDRYPLAPYPRRFFKLTTALDSAQWLALRNFYNAHIGAAFYFYAPRETVPPFSYDATGQATAGRYTVVFDGAYSENTGPGRSQANFGLREVA